MFLLDKIKYEIEVIDKIVDSICVCSNDWFNLFNDNVGTILDMFQMMISIQPELEKMGIDIPVALMEQQVGSINEAVTHKDFMLLADVLKYEVTDILCAFEELVKGGIIKNEELL